MKVGLIGIPQSGQTTLFTALTRGEGSPAGGGSGAMVSVVPVPDARYDFAVELFHPKKRTPATIEFTDGAAQISAGGDCVRAFDTPAEPARTRLIQAAYKALGVMSFFTVGEDEVRAWTIPLAGTALIAAGRIHSDLARGFIRAEVTASDDLIAVKTWDAAKGKMRLEGKDYLVKDGDIFHVRFKV